MKSILAAHRNRRSQRRRLSPRVNVESLECRTLLTPAWIELNPLVRPTARQDHTMVEIGNQLYVFGGRAPGGGNVNAVNDLWRFDPDTLEFELLTPTGTTPKPRYAHTATAANGKMYIAYGFGGAEVGIHSDLWEYDPAANAWTEVIPADGIIPTYPDLPIPAENRLWPTLTTIGDHLYLFGGFNENSGIQSDLWRFDLTTSTWSRLADGTGVRFGHSAVEINGLLYIYGGQTVFGFKRDDMIVYDPSTDEWTEVVPSNPATTADSTFPAEGQATNLPAGSTASGRPQDTVTTPGATAFHSYFSEGERFWMFGGEGISTSSSASDVWKYDVGAKTWTSDPDNPTPIKRASGALYFGNNFGQDSSNSNDSTDTSAPRQSHSPSSPSSTTVPASTAGAPRILLFGGRVGFDEAGSTVGSESNRVFVFNPEATGAPTGSATIQGRVLLDNDGDGQRDSGESWLSGPRLQLVDADDRIVATTTTQDIDLNGDGTIDPETETGIYRFENVPAGRLTVRVESFPGQRIGGASDLNAQLAHQLDQQLNLFTTGKLFEDWGGLGEKWMLGRNPDGTTSWYFITPDGLLRRWIRSSPSNLRGEIVGTVDPIYHTDPSLLFDSQQPVLTTIDVADGQTIDGPDFSTARAGRIEGRKFEDLNDNGTRDENEPYLNGWRIELVNPQGRVIATSVTHTIDDFLDQTDDDGWYRFDNVPAGDYTIREVSQPGWRPTGTATELSRRARELDETLRFRSHGNLFENWGGRGEKWFQGRGHWYFITPDGSLFQWDRSPRDNLTGTLIDTFDAHYHAAPSLLFDAPDPSTRRVTVASGQALDINIGNIREPAGTDALDTVFSELMLP